jgi:sulfotransferase family protein
MTIFHITHWKAGSQWIKKILLDAMPEQYVDSKIGIAHFLEDPIQEGKVYPTVYVTKEQFYGVNLPSNYRKFVVIRDIRDTLVSGYFSLKVSHAVIAPIIDNYRQKLNSCSLEEGLLFLASEWLPASADIQKSWIAGGEEIFKYEDLLCNDVEILCNILLEKCGAPVSRQRLIDTIIANRFERMSGGRLSGNEDISSHQRKGISGDWRNYFTDKVTEYFKSSYGKLLIDSGYENDFNW